MAIVRVAKLAARLAIGISIDDDDGPVISLPACLGFCQLRSVEGAVATAADDNNVSQRMSLPPSITRTVPVA